MAEPKPKRLRTMNPLNLLTKKAPVDWDTYQKFWDYTNHLKSQGCAILIVTHMLSEKERFDRIFEIEMGILK